ncbi:MAG: hypothetical protein LBF60_07800 [Treponema sp.]|jgi:hypothetical protein|nr:hypothetical protein [Treponema sp.]
MKRIIIAFVLCGLVLVSNLFSYEESDFSLGFAYGGVFDITENTARPTGSFTNALGISLVTYGFWDDKQPGMFFHLGGLFNSSSVKDGILNYNSVIEDIVVGPGFRVNLNDVLTFRYGVGFDFSMEACDYRKQDAEDDYSVVSLDFGLGGNANVKLDVTDIFCVVLGVNVTCTVADWTLSSAESTTSKWTFAPIIGIKPYIGLGWNMYNEYSHFGKPPFKKNM